jgi:Domain of unknown function (DUF4157)
MKACECKTPAIQAKKNSSFFGKESGQAFFQTRQSGPPFFSKRSSNPGMIQPKLSIGKPNDHYEREADHMADQVVRRLSNPPSVQARSLGPVTPVASAAGPSVVQEKCAHCEQEEKMQKKEEEQGMQKDKIKLKPIFESNAEPPEESIMRKCAACAKEENGIESRLASSKGGGTPLPDGTRQRMESAFDRDFSNVRIHNGPEAVQMSQDLNAQAFTHGSDIYFNSGKYDSGSRSGSHLLAHELTHVVQQGAAGDTLQRLPSLSEIGEDISNAVDSGTQAVSDAVDSGTQAVKDAGQALYNAGADAVNTVEDAASDAVSWLASAAGKAAVALANEVVSAFGGTVTISGTTIIIDIPDVSLFDSFQKDLGDELPAIPIFEMPIFGGGIGAFDFLATLEVNLTPSLLAAIGPGELRNIRLTLDPLSTTFTGHAELYAAASLGARLSIFGGLVGRGLGVIPTDPPIPLEASLEGGLRGTGTAWDIGAINSIIDLSYRSGTWGFTADNNLMFGLLLQGDLDLYAAAKVFEMLVCEYSYPLGHWEAGDAYKINIPVSLGGGSPPSVGPVTGSPMPVQDIKTAIQPLEHGLQCKTMEEILDELCKEGLLPKEVCDYIKKLKHPPSTPPAVPGTTAAGTPLVCSRPLETALLGKIFNHAFVYDPNNGNKYAIREPFVWGNGLRGCINSTTASKPPDDPKTSTCKPCNPQPGKTTKDVSDCILNAHLGYPSPNIYMNMFDPSDRFHWGPNSNTYAATLAKCCADPSSSGLGKVPGWNHKPSTPCSAKPVGPVAPAAAGCVPTFKSLTAKKTGNIQMTDSWNGKCELAFGVNSAPGMSFETKVDVPAGCTGTLAYVQLIDRCLQRTEASGTNKSLKTSGFALDTSDPYSDKKVTAPGTFTMKDSDSPSGGYAGTNTFLYVTDQFKMWVMWTPDSPAGAPRVPLAKVDWNWTAKSNKTGTTGCASAWTISADSASGGTGAATTTPPTWSKQYQKDFKFGPGTC